VRAVVVVVAAPCRNQMAGIGVDLAAVRMSNRSARCVTVSSVTDAYKAGTSCHGMAGICSSL